MGENGTLLHLLFIAFLKTESIEDGVEKNLFLELRYFEGIILVSITVFKSEA